MSTGTNIDSRLVTWGDRLFYPGNRIVKPIPPAYLHASLARRADVIRQRITATIRQTPQAFVRITGGGRGINDINIHLRYITQDGRLAFEDDREVTRKGNEALLDLQNQWRYGGSYIAARGQRREVLNILLAMPAGTDPDRLQKAARDFAKAELAGHRYVMVLHRHQAHPHVHLCVKLESGRGERLNHGRADLRRWRETFAERLRSWGVDAEATHRRVRGSIEIQSPLWLLRAQARGERPRPSPDLADHDRPYQEAHCLEAVFCWMNIGLALMESDRPNDRQLAIDLRDFLSRTPFMAQTLKKYPDAFPEVRRYLATLKPERERQILTPQRPDREWTR